MERHNCAQCPTPEPGEKECRICGRPVSKMWWIVNGRDIRRMTPDALAKMGIHPGGMRWRWRRK